MRINNLVSGILFGCLIFIISCSSDQSSYPSIDFISPEEIIIDSDVATIHIEVEVVDDDELSDYELSIVSSSNFVFFNDKKTIKGTHHTIEYLLEITESLPSQFTIRIYATDIEGHRTKKEMTVTMID